MSVFYLFFTLVLFSELRCQWAVVALPASKVEDGTIEQDGLNLILNDKSISDPALGFLMRRTTGLGSHIRDYKGTSQNDLLSDMHVKGQDTTGPSLSRGIALLTNRNPDHFPDSIIKIDRRDTDLDMLRCMIGRVYRPCWEV